MVQFYDILLSTDSSMVQLNTSGLLSIDSSMVQFWSQLTAVYSSLLHTLILVEAATKESLSVTDHIIQARNSSKRHL